jgi:carbamoyltransferase
MVTLGISGARRNAAAAVCVGRTLVAACEQERLVRVRAVGLNGRRLPEEAVDAVLALAGCGRSQVVRVATAENGLLPVPGTETSRLEHHQGHAATAFLTSPFRAAAVLICDGSSAATVWIGAEETLRRTGLEFRGPGLADLYSRAAAALGFPGREHELEALAGLSDGRCVDVLRTAATYRDGEIRVSPAWDATISEWARTADASLARRSEAAGSIQRRLGELLLQMAGDVRRETGMADLCLGGGLFYNTYFNTLVARSGLFDRVHVPDNPGNAGLAVGAALAAATGGQTPAPRVVSSFLGPEYDEGEIKATLDNCKLSYSYASERDVIAQAVEALARGHLVGWFDGRMEWGHRALGHRSILASPLSPYALENLNGFLKRRPSWRPYGLSVCDEDVGEMFEGPAASRAMEYEYQVRDPERLHAVMPPGARRLRVHTVSRENGRFHRLLKAFGASSGLPAVVNTSFNGLHEPIVCSPRDAVRVFYGTGLDLLAIGPFLLRK